MPDDDKQPSHERLDETNPERGRRSFFDWLRGKEETDEEKLRKKLDEELKEAARKRAEQFEEERRVEESREVAETRKLKKRWRAKLVEKSKELLQNASERGEEPTSGYEIAKLMVAERIVKLHDILQTEDLRRSEVKSLKIHIDFMGLLSEKLDRPELDVPEEIEQLYQTIASSVEETTGEALPKVPVSTPEVVPTSEADAAYTAFAASIVRAVRHALRKEPSVDASDGSESSNEPPSPTTDEKSIPQPPGVNLRVAEQLLSVVKGTALSEEAIRKEISHTEQVRNLAEVVEKAAIIDRFVEYAAKKTIASAQTESARPTPENIEPSPNKKIKYLTDSELVRLAATVEVGSGRLLSDVYLHGELDREGLVKVLESYRKGQDYRSEFTLRLEKWRNHKTESQEYLAKSAASQPKATTSLKKPIRTAPERIKQHAKAFGHQMTSLVSTSKIKGKLRNIGLRVLPTFSAIKKHIPTPVQAEQSVSQRVRRQAQIALLFASVLIVIIVFIVVIDLNSH